MITLIALITGSAAPSLLDELDPVGPVNPVDIPLPDIAPATENLAICPIPGPSVRFLSELERANSYSPISSKGLDEYQVELIDENTIASDIPMQGIDAGDVAEAMSGCAVNDMATWGSPDTGSGLEQITAFHEQSSQIKISPKAGDGARDWFQGVMDRNDSVHFGDVSDWLKDANSIYNEEPLFRSILNLPFPSDQSQLFPDHISTQPTYKWVVDNCLTDWINDRVTGVVTPDPGATIDNHYNRESNESTLEVASPKTFGQIYMPFVEKLESLDGESTRDFFCKIYELLAPLRGFLVLAITGLEKKHDLTGKGKKLSGLLNQSGFAAGNIRMISSHRHHYLVAKRCEARSDVSAIVL